MTTKDDLDLIRMRADIQLKSLVAQARGHNREVVICVVWSRKYPSNPHFKESLAKAKASRQNAMFEAKNLRWVLTGNRTKAEERRSERFYTAIKKMPVVIPGRDPQ